jgi:hypothetical protein
MMVTPAATPGRWGSDGIMIMIIITAITATSTSAVVPVRHRHWSSRE